MWLTLLARYWKPLAALALCAALLFTGWHMRGTHDQAQAARTLIAQQKALMDANAKAEQANVALIAELQKPKAGVEIRELVRNNPSQCVMPTAVFNGLLRAIREANAAR